MLKIRNLFLVLGMLLCTTVNADVRISIGINVPAYPEFVVVPGYPVYYAPRMEANMFFYDGLYWVYHNDNWYESSWYNGPWWLVYPEDVPLFILRIPVRYYRMPPVYFIGWQFNAPPRWGDHWGRDWSQHRRDWDKWDRRYVPAPAPLPAYQRQYSGDRYPRQVEQQRELHQKNYRFQPRDPEVRRQHQEQSTPRAPVQQNNRQQERQIVPEDRGYNQDERQRVPENRGSSQQDNRRYEPSRSEPSQQTEPRRQDRPDAPRSRSPQDGGMKIERSPQADAQQERTENQIPRNQATRQQQGQEVIQREQNEPRSQGQRNKQQGDERPGGQDRSQDRGKGRDD